MNFKIRKVRSEKHRRFIASKACIITGLRDGVQSHHLLRAGDHSMGSKACDSWCIPLHHTIHDALHKNGNEVVFFTNHGMDYEDVKRIAVTYSTLSPDKKIREVVKLRELQAHE